MTEVDETTRISALAAELRASGRIGRSELFDRLFVFLLEQSLAGRSPKEIEVAQEVFGRDARFDVAQDASVRVTIHRLRKKLDEAYAGTAGDRLVIPRGEYRIALQPADAAVAEPEPEPLEVPATPVAEPPVPPRRWWRIGRRWQVGLALALAVLAGVGLGLGVAARRGAAANPAISSAFWQTLAGSPRLTFVVTGDYYIFGEAARSPQVNRLVREFNINSREDLDDYLMTHPEDMGRYVDLDLHYLPVSTATALGTVLPMVDGITGRMGVGRPWVITMSRLTPEAMKGSNIVYVGFLSGLGLLRDPVFQASGFQVGASYDELIDRATGRRYVSDFNAITDARAPRRDYAYLASFPGPSGNRMLVVAGTRDAAVTQAAAVAADKAKLDQIAERAGRTDGFEALYEVRTLGNLDLGSTLVLARPLKLAGLWRPDGKPQQFPDQRTAAH